MGSLLRTQLAIEECEQHLGMTGAAGTPIESYLTQHILVILCAEIQQEIYSIVDKKTLDLTNKEFSNYISASQKKVLRGVKIEAISGFLGLFSAQAKNCFGNALSDQEKTTYNNAVSDRHDVAHKYGVNITFTELKLANSLAQKVLDNIEKALS